MAAEKTSETGNEAERFGLVFPFRPPEASVGPLMVLIHHLKYASGLRKVLVEVFSSYTSQCNNNSHFNNHSYQFPLFKKSFVF